MSLQLSCETSPSFRDLHAAGDDHSTFYPSPFLSFRQRQARHENSRWICITLGVQIRVTTPVNSKIRIFLSLSFLVVFSSRMSARCTHRRDVLYFCSRRHPGFEARARQLLGGDRPAGRRWSGRRSPQILGRWICCMHDGTRQQHGWYF